MPSIKAEKFAVDQYPRTGWLKKVGLMGFVFFLCKGLVWIAIVGWALL
jgi:hypothetical protein